MSLTKVDRKVLQDFCDIIGLSPFIVIHVFIHILYIYINIYIYTVCTFHLELNILLLYNSGRVPSSGKINILLFYSTLLSKSMT